MVHKDAHDLLWGKRPEVQRQGFVNACSDAGQVGRKGLIFAWNIDVFGPVQGACLLGYTTRGRLISCYVLWER